MFGVQVGKAFAKQTINATRQFSNASNLNKIGQPSVQLMTVSSAESVKLTKVETMKSPNTFMNQLSKGSIQYDSPKVEVGPNSFTFSSAELRAEMPVTDNFTAFVKASLGNLHVGGEKGFDVSLPNLGVGGKVSHHGKSDYSLEADLSATLSMDILKTLSGSVEGSLASARTGRGVEVSQNGVSVKGTSDSYKQELHDGQENLKTNRQNNSKVVDDLFNRHVDFNGEGYAPDVLAKLLDHDINGMPASLDAMKSRNQCDGTSFEKPINPDKLNRS